MSAYHQLRFFFFGAAFFLGAGRFFCIAFFAGFLAVFFALAFALDPAFVEGIATAAVSAANGSNTRPQSLQIIWSRIVLCTMFCDAQSGHSVTLSRWSSGVIRATLR
jgi:hypothetical protein